MHVHVSPVSTRNDMDLSVKFQQEFTLFFLSCFNRKSHDLYSLFSAGNKKNNFSQVSIGIEMTNCISVVCKGTDMTLSVLYQQEMT